MVLTTFTPSIPPLITNITDVAPIRIPQNNFTFIGASFIFSFDSILISDTVEVIESASVTKDKPINNNIIGLIICDNGNSCNTLSIKASLPFCVAYPTKSTP
ncbi:hypothetical protein SDC9_167818 [bioreactor metagenome]|uniref:Uncharacterized protein n=1 Tax=bioreactor metagenome TaxID=1076179 RepID=A0A645G3Q1_9ZZZZ